MLDDTQAALRRVQERYLRPRDANDGVYVRLWECSLPCIGGSCATCNTVQRCVLHELNQTQVIGSLHEREVEVRVGDRWGFRSVTLLRPRAQGA